MRPPVTKVIAAHAVPARLVAPLDDGQVRAASALPGWTRGHVLAHLTDNARMFTRLAEHALRGELVRAEDLRREWARDDRHGPVVTGRLRDLAAWMAGRVPAALPVALPVAPEGLPALGPWPPHPPRSRG
ncbi:hypothetical protein GCM10010234_14980 [Streptomyces hawaiiensis]|uniref:maleylpyruvate isomerase N-terminal domain-containing protein n=1 Tax=Streptomyces hawaiiensis TaxID=67305 RepID=UPI0031DD77F9